MPAVGLHTPFWTEGTFFRAEFYRPFCSVSLLMLSNFFKIISRYWSTYSSSFKSLTQKQLIWQRIREHAQNEPFALAGERFQWLFVIPPRNYSHSFCYCFLQLVDGLGVVLIHSVFQVAPQLKMWMVHVRGMGGPLRVAPPTDESAR